GRDQIEEPLFVEQFEILKKELLSEGFPFFFYEDLSQIEIPKWYGLCELIVVPSIGSEGLPKSITESLAMGVPVIASDRGGIWELLEEGRNGWKIEEPVSADTIKGALEKALALSEQEREEMRKQILENDRPKMDEKIMADQMKSLIEKLIGEGK
nr:glycosyltransferase family 4 protein [Anaerolineaceae bacterium]